MAHLHTTFITIAYCFAGFVLGAMLLWVALDYRTQQKTLAALEAKRVKKS